MRACSVLMVLATAGCSVPVVTEHLELESPPPELGRPGYVRFSAKVGAWAGAIGGAAASVVLLLTLVGWTLRRGRAARAALAEAEAAERPRG